MASNGNSSQNIKLEDLKMIIQKLYFEPNAAEQIENILNGRNDRKGPLTKTEKKMFLDNPGFTSFMRKLCIEKAVTDIGLETWKTLTDGLNVGNTNVGRVTQTAESNIDVRNRRLQNYIRNDRTVKDLLEHINADVDKSMEFSVGLRGKIDEFIEIQENNPGFRKQREKGVKTIDIPTRDIIEQANGSDAHTKQAATFISYIIGNNNISLVQGPYTYKELARIIMTSGARQAFKEMYQCQRDRQKFYDPVDRKAKYFNKGEKKSAEISRQKFGAEMTQAMASHKKEIGSASAMSLKEYKDRVAALHEKENGIRSQYSDAILDLSVLRSRREAQNAKTNDIVAEEITGDFYSKYDKAFQGLDDYVANARDEYAELINSGKMDRLIEEEDDRSGR